MAAPVMRACPTMDPRFDWFSAWVDDHVLLTLTAVSTPDPSRLLAAFGPTTIDRGSLSLREVGDIRQPTVRIGTSGGWSYAVEHASTVGGDPMILERLTSEGSLAVALCWTPNIRTVHIARSGEHLCGFEADAPNSMRWGREPRSFDAQIREAGLEDPGDQRPGAACAAFLELMTGMTLTRAMLEDRLPCATLPAPEATVSQEQEAGEKTSAPLVPGLLIPELPPHERTSARS